MVMMVCQFSEFSGYTAVCLSSISVSSYRTERGCDVKTYSLCGKPSWYLYQDALDYSSKSNWSLPHITYYSYLVVKMLIKFLKEVCLHAWIVFSLNNLFIFSNPVIKPTGCFLEETRELSYRHEENMHRHSTHSMPRAQG